MVADRLWLVKDGPSRPMTAIWRAIATCCSGDSPTKHSAKAPNPPPKKSAPSARTILALRADARKCEERVEKLNEMRDKLAKKLADPALYEDATRRRRRLATRNTPR